MLKEKDNFIIEYDKEYDYLDSLVETLETEGKRILAFFDLEKLSEKQKIKIWSSIEEYKKHLEPYVEKYYDWMNGDTYDGNINMLDINECRKTHEHKDITMEKYLKIILHEYVHICQKEVTTNNKVISWFWEALATNLGNPYYKIVDIKYDKESLSNNFQSLKNNYPTAYTIGKYMLENIPHNKLIYYVKNPDILYQDSDMIIENTKKWFNEKYLKEQDIERIKKGEFVFYKTQDDKKKIKGV